MHCPSTFYRPSTREGKIIAGMIGDLVGQVRIGMAGPAGLDLPACLAMTDSENIDREVAIPMLLAVQRGLMRVFGKKKDEDEDAETDL